MPKNNVIRKVRPQNSLEVLDSRVTPANRKLSKEVNLLLTSSEFQNSKNQGLIKTENTEVYPSCWFYFIFNESGPI